jgi:type I restriction enzyme S subunit
MRHSFFSVFSLANSKELQVQKSKYLGQGLIPIVDQGNKKVAGWVNGDDAYKDLPVIIFGDHTRVIKWVNFEFRPGADGTQILKSNNGFDQKFCYYALCNVELPNLGYSRHLKELKEIHFSMPGDIGEQRKISAFLTHVDEKLLTLSSQMEAVKKYKQGLLQQMFI